tara:strand:+ start:196 stop:342 length:147 start_codon:yes stop_codon:yes gene_type:complete
MSASLIAVIGVVYLVVAGSLFMDGKTGLAVAFLGYALGNVGLFMEARM